MAEQLIYTPNPNDINKFLKHIQSAGVPAKVTNNYLESVGFRSKNHRYLIPVMKAIGFIDSSGTPTGLWKEYRDKGKARQILGAAIRDAYPDLFATYPDANAREAEAIRNFLSARTSVAEVTLQRAVATFRALATNGDFGAAAGVSRGEVPTPSPTDKAESAVLRTIQLPTLNVNIELHLPATDDGAVYEKLFEALRKHLIDG
jgi:hypothetical protein